MPVIDQLFASLRAQRRKALMPFVTAGDPDLEFTAAVLGELVARGENGFGTLLRVARWGAPLGFDGRDGWRGWDTVRAEMPLSEVSDLIVDLRSLTQGVGTFEMEFDHFAELNGKLAEQVVATQRAA